MARTVTGVAETVRADRPAHDVLGVGVEPALRAEDVQTGGARLVDVEFARRMQEVTSRIPRPDGRDTPSIPAMKKKQLTSHRRQRLNRTKKQQR